MTDNALSCSARGWNVIPLRPRDKRPALPSWADYQSRRATEEEIREWWDRWPDANIGLVTGTVSGLIVLDLDGPEAADFAKRQGVPPTVIATTGKGWHVYFAHPGRVMQNAASLAGVKGLDVRADGGYVVAPPSVHPSGRVYQWVKGRSPDDVALAPCPEWLLELLANREGRNTDLQTKVNPLAVLAGVPEGQRDVTLFRYACRLRAQGLTREETERLILEAARNCTPPFPEKVALKKVDQAWKYPPGKALREIGNGGRKVFRLEGPVYTPEAWQTLVICKGWLEARQQAALGNAVAVLRRDGSLPPEAGRLVAVAGDVKMAGFTPEEARRLAWELYPLRLVSRAVTEGTAALKPEPAKVEMAAPEPEPAQEPEPPDLAAPPPAPEPSLEPDPASNRFLLECWLSTNRPSLLAAIRRAEEECNIKDIYYFAGLPDRLAAAEAALAQAVAEGQRVMREALAAGREGPGPEEAPGPEAQEGRELTFEEVERLFGGFERVWWLTAAQAAYLEKIFRFKGPVVVRSENGLWWSAEDWRS
ncbi:MAG: bifunctional DNA primase/polymerase [Firmicutes bacterium]|nr:bifunctional DNA primase/polymerase [Bacillota bacterium]